MRKIIETIPGQGIVKNPTDKPEKEILASQLFQHSKLMMVYPGFKPDAVFPYSFGIFAGAVITGAISNEVAFSLVGQRADIVRAAEGSKPEEERSAMGVFLASKELVANWLGRFPDIDWTNINGPKAQVLGGSVKDLMALAAEAGRNFRGILTAEGIYHSDKRKPEAELFKEVVENTPVQKSKIPLITSTNVREITHPDDIREEMWTSMTQQVNLEEVVRHLIEKGYDSIVDTSLGGTIQQLMQRIHSGFKFVTIEDEVDKVRELLKNLGSAINSTKIASP
jgi:acyl transferase domain-containing protein